MLTNNIILAISGRATLRSLGVWFRPFANNVRDPKYYERGKQFQENYQTEIYTSDLHL